MISGAGDPETVPRRNLCMKQICAILTVAFLPNLALAEVFERVTDRDDFIALTNGQTLRRFGVSLNVAPEGTITGKALGFTVSGAWTWEDGFFCRTLDYGSGSFEHNCQVVLQNGDAIRFIADRGTGDTAELKLR